MASGAWRRRRASLPACAPGLHHSLCLHDRGKELSVSPAGIDEPLVSRRLVRTPGHLAAAVAVPRSRADRHIARTHFRDAGGGSTVARPLLREGIDLAAVRSPYRPAGHHYRHRIAIVLRHNE